MILRGRLWLVNTFAGREDGQAMAEYTFILGLVALAAIGAFTSFGETVAHLFQPIAKAVAP
jgi:Flp pilus assembly pilin Flp